MTIHTFYIILMPHTDNTSFFRPKYKNNITEVVNGLLNVIMFYMDSHLKIIIS